MEQAKDLGLFSWGNIKSGLVFERNDDGFVVTKIIPRRYRRETYKIVGKGTLEKVGEGKLKVEIDYTVIDIRAAIGFCAAVILMCVALGVSAYEVANGSSSPFLIIGAYLVLLAIIFVARFSPLAEIDKFHKEIRTYLNQPAENQFPDENHISTKD
ncbi:hypothetical protein [Taibaiella soli]|nr:hypothetical protein [Taibaiella soli]